MRLGDFADLIRGVSFDGAEASQLPGPGLMPILRAGNIAGRLITDTNLVWVPRGRVSVEQQLRLGDIAIYLSSGSPSVVGKTAVVDRAFDGAVGAFCGVVRPHRGVDPTYLSLWFRSPAYRAWRNTQSRGVGIQNLRLTDLARIELTVPSLDKQHQVAERLTAQLASVDRARHAAVWKLDAVRDLRASTLTHAFEPSSNGRWAQLGRIGTLTDGDWILNADYAADGVRLLQVGDIGRGQLRMKSRRYVTADRARELNCTLLEPGDILISRMADPIGRACILPELGYPAITAVDVSILRVRKDVADREFLTFYMDSPSWLDEVLSHASGATRPRISRKNLEALSIPMPPIERQREVAGVLRARLDAIDDLADAASAQLRSIEALQGALLRRAFRAEAA